MELPDLCDECGYLRPAAVRPRGGDRRGFLTVVDGAQVRRICTTCGLRLLSRVDNGLKMTVIL
jgi:hypothetical protein